MSDDLADRRIADRLETLRAIRESQRDAHRLVDILLNADDPASAVDTLVAELGISRLGATAILDMQVRRLSRRDRARIEDEIAELESGS